jgi:DNA-binding CsgD family transcriptional regulator
MSYDPIRTVEASYAAGLTEAEWLRGLLTTLLPLRDARAFWAVTFDTADPSRLRLGDIVAAGDFPRGVEDGFRSTWERIPAEFSIPFWRSAPVFDTMTRRLRSHPAPSPQMRGYLEAVPGEAASLVAANPDGRGVQLGYLAAPGHVPAPRTVHRLRLVAAHVAAGLRLRQQARAHLDSIGDSDAVVRPSGKLESAGVEPPGAIEQSRLGEAVRSVERARGGLRRTDPDEALALWRGLLSGEWSLVDRHERDGRRLILARRNRPGVPDVKALRRREREVLSYAVRGHSNKYVAYVLGVSAASVAVHLASALAKLGVRSRREAIDLLGGGVPRAPSSVRVDGEGPDGS